MADDNVSAGQDQARHAEKHPDRMGGKEATASDNEAKNTIEESRGRDNLSDRADTHQALDRIARRIDNDDPESLLKAMHGDKGLQRDVVNVSREAIENAETSRLLSERNEVLKQLLVVSKSSEATANQYTKIASNPGTNEEIRYSVRADLERGEFVIRKEHGDATLQESRAERVSSTKDLNVAIAQAEALADRDKTKQENKKSEDKDEQNLEPRSAFLARLEKRYVRANGYDGERYHFRDDLSVVAFEVAVSVLGKNKLITDHNDPDVVRSMVDRARADGWTTIHVKGHDEFKREAWLAASMAGIKVKGYRANDLDHALLEELQRGRAAKGNQYEQTGNRKTSPDHPPAEKVLNEGRTVDESKVTKPQETALIALEQTLRERGDSEKQIAMAVSIAREQFQQKRVYAGTLKEHGGAPYEFNDKNEKSYYVKLEDSYGKQQHVWGVHLPEALKKGDAKIGDEIFVAFQGRNPVTIKVADRDADGKVTGHHEVTTHRNTWAVNRFDTLSEQAKNRLRELAGETAKQPVVRQYDHAAMPKMPNIPPPTREHVGERHR
jgi:Large polyvalent protein-associated domain 7